VLFDHVTIRVSDRAASERFYDTVLATLGLGKSHSDEWGDFSLAAGPPLTRGLHIGFGAPSREHVDAFWQAGVDAGYRDDGAPGPRPEYGSTYYGGFLLDPDGNSAEAVHHGRSEPGAIDHLWIRVADLEAARRFYETIAPHAGFRLRGSGESPRRYQFAGEMGSFSVVEGGRPAEHVHLAFSAATNDAVDAFHRAALAAGYRDNGAPGERPLYHAGYYGAYVLDPDGNNVEVVNHNR
jgi:catechol 2,3-dioxygenase-like lactoylglutathione lyase family enzyme